MGGVDNGGSYVCVWGAAGDMRTLRFLLNFAVILQLLYIIKSVKKKKAAVYKPKLTEEL